MWPELVFVSAMRSSTGLPPALIVFSRGFEDHDIKICLGERSPTSSDEKCDESKAHTKSQWWNQTKNITYIDEKSDLKNLMVSKVMCSNGTVSNVEWWFL